MTATTETAPAARSTISLRIAGTDNDMTIERTPSIKNVEDLLTVATQQFPGLSVKGLSPVVNSVSATLKTPVPESATVSFSPRVQNG